VSLLIVGQFLNYTVFHRLERGGVFYGARFGHAVPWCTDFPFSVLRHPQRGLVPAPHPGDPNPFAPSSARSFRARIEGRAVGGTRVPRYAA